jgi:DNA topoisomerase-3
MPTPHPVSACGCIDDAGVDPRGFLAIARGQRNAPGGRCGVPSESDWLVGINGTRAMTAFNSRSGGFHLTTVGRVQTPTLAILVEREDKIKKFVSRDYYEVHATFACKAGEYVGRWLDEQFSKDKKPDDSDLKPERLWERARADAIRAKCQGGIGVVEEESKASTQLSPRLYDLTSLQRDANGRFGFSAKTTLSIAQALYEKHKVLTYPRTDSRALPEDYLSTATASMLALDKSFQPFVKQILANKWVRPNKRIFNNAKISDHFAIIPTSIAPKNLSEAEAKIYTLVTKRFLAVFFPAAEFQITTRITPRWWCWKMRRATFSHWWGVPTTRRLR